MGVSFNLTGLESTTPLFLIQVPFFFDVPVLK